MANQRAVSQLNVFWLDEHPSAQKSRHIFWDKFAPFLLFVREKRMCLMMLFKRKICVEINPIYKIRDKRQ